MIDSKPELILYGTDRSFLAELESACAPLPYVTCKRGSGFQITQEANLDAIWITPMAGFVLFGLNPPFHLQRPAIVRTPHECLRRGLPRYGIVGGAIPKGDLRNRECALREILSALLSAVAEFNLCHEDQILRIGIQPDELNLKSLDGWQVPKIIREVYERIPEAMAGFSL